MTYIRYTYFAYFQLFVFALLLMRPALPLFNYWLHYDYIATNLCENKNKPKSTCNGKCHLVKQLAKTQDKTEKDTTKDKKEDVKTDWFQITRLCNISVFNSSSHSYPKSVYPTLTGSDSLFFVPPEV